MTGPKPVALPLGHIPLVIGIVHYSKGADDKEAFMPTTNTIGIVHYSKGADGLQ